MKNIVSFSGGKDSTAMILHMLEDNKPVDEIIFFDTGWEFPQMIEHVDKVEAYIGRKITHLYSPEPVKYLLLEKPIVRHKKSAADCGKIYRLGHGWPTPRRRWCTYFKQRTVRWYLRDKYENKCVVSLGIAADESHRLGKNIGKYKYEHNYPLVDYGMDENDCLQYCYDRGFDWSGLYEKFCRVSCYCCPLQRIGELRNLREYYPELWKKMLEMDSAIPHNRGFRGYKTVRDLDDRFANEDLQQEF